MQPRLTERDLEVLKHVARYRIATLVSLHRTLFSKVQPRAVGKVTRRLVRNGWMLKHPLGPRRCYYTLTPQSARLLDHPAHGLGKPLEPAELLRQYGLLKYCCLAEHGRKKLSGEEIETEHPYLSCVEPDSAHFFLDAGYRPAVCGMARVDGGDEPAQFVAACRDDWRACFRQAAFRRHVAEAGFRLVLLTATEDRAEALRALVAEHRWPDKLRVAVEVLPQLLPLYLGRKPFSRNGSRTLPGGIGAGNGAGGPQPQLMPRDYEILQHVLRYRIATIKSLHRIFFPEMSRHAAIMVCVRLLRNGWLRRHRLTGTRCYYMLSPRAIRLLGNPPDAVAWPLPPAELARAYALLRYCCTGRRRRLRLTHKELRTEHPQLLCPGLDWDRYFLDTQARAAARGMIFHDSAGDTAGTVSTCRADWLARWDHGRFRRLVVNEGFRLVLLTAGPHRAAALREQMKRHRWPQQVRWDVETIPELNLLAADDDNEGD